MDERVEPVKTSFTSSIESTSSAGASANTVATMTHTAPVPPEKLSLEVNHGYILNDPLGKHPILIKDPLSDVTRRERKAFLGLSVLAIAVIKANLIPSELSAFGVKIDNVRRDWLITLLTAVVFYFLMVFIAYALSDFLGWRIAFWEGVRARAIEREKIDKEAAEGSDEDSSAVAECNKHRRALSAKAIPTSAIRAFLDFALPVFIGIAALLVLRGCA